MTILFTAGSVFGSMTGLGYVVVMFVWTAGTAIGLVTLVLTIRHVLLR